jgi:hypothetical protein
MTITAANRQIVILRAGGCCEYCRLKKTDETSPFHIDHIVPIKHHGSDDVDNLCFCCYQCNAYKGSNVAAADPVSGKAEFLFHPRSQTWAEHFEVGADGMLNGKTPQGRVTVDVLRMNEELRIEYRLIAMWIGEYPCE